MCSIDRYDSRLDALSVSSGFGTFINKSLYDTAFEIIISNLRLKKSSLYPKS
jgi:hypothetical protein